MTTIPVVSFSNFLTGNREDQEEVAKQVYNAFSTVGFIYLKDYGIPQTRVDEIINLVSFFQLLLHYLLLLIHSISTSPKPFSNFPCPPSSSTS